MKFVTNKSTILIGTILVIIALSMSFTSSSEVVSMAGSEVSLKTKVQNKSKSTANAHLKSQSRVRKEKFYSFETPPGAPAPPSVKLAAAPAPAAKKENAKENVKENAKENGENAAAAAGKDIILSDWLLVSSGTFKNSAIFPEIFTGYMNTNIRIRTDGYNFRINDAHKKDANANNNPEHEKHFWFRLTKEMIFYSSTKEDLNILGGNKIAHIVHAATLKRHDLGYYCFSINDRSGHDWKICSELEKTRDTWFCAVQKLRGEKLEKFCPGNEDDANIVYKNIIQPYIIIPIPSRRCNEDWNYQNQGDDWECDCSEGREQSPIDLPLRDKAIESSMAPLFKFSIVKPTEVKTVENGRTRETETLKFKLNENNLRIRNAKFGKTITPDGSIYDAEEIVIHTPAEHQIDGKKFAMELQIIHNGKSVGDIGKQLILSFVFEKKAGVYNKFIDDLDFFNLPNPISPVVDIVHDLFIPKIFYSSDDKEIPKMKPFSFYTYQGSLTAPPCSEDTIVYVASKPIEIGTTALHLFQEALRIPDMINEKGDVTVSDSIPISNRNIQPLNGRPVFHYDHEKHCGPDKKKEEEDDGHYEKIRQVKTKYFYVPDQKISGIPNAFVVSKNEAMNIQK